MDATAKQHFIQSKATEQKVKWSIHALAELSSESWTVSQVEFALRRAEIIEDYPHMHRHLPDCLILSFALTGEPLHAVVALNESRDYILVVTVYRPNEQEWENDWRTRK